MLRAVLLTALTLQAAADPYTAEIQAWRVQRLERLKANGGWLTVTGLFWLKPGANTVGTDASNNFVLRPGSAPGRLGRFEFDNGKTTFVSQTGQRQELKANSKDQIAAGELRMFAIERGGRYGIRLIDHQSPLRTAFKGLDYYPVQPAYKVTARWVAYPAGRTIPIANVLGQTEPLPCPGYAEFQLHGSTVRLEPVLEGEELFFIFKDRTAGAKTYPAGRFLYTPLARDGKLVIDFNKAYNPPCAFTPFATCPLPPRQNHLPVAIEAGELKYR